MVKRQGKKKARVGGLVPDHPLGVKPWGSFLLCGGRNCRPTGLGTLSRLSDELLLDVLGRLSARNLCSAASCSRMLYSLCNHEELWRSLALTEQGRRFCYRDNWKTSYLQNCVPARCCSASAIQCKGVYSDMLYQPWLCATTPIEQAWLCTDNLERSSGLSPVGFRERYEAASWPARTKWSRAFMAEAFQDSEVVVGEMNMPLQSYFAYLDAAQDEMPLYLFDKAFADKAPILRQHFQVPACFEDDLFSVLGQQRPDHSWLIWGPGRSGSSFHKDPNGTSAWNAVVSGSKKWILYPPHVLPPGVHASPDGADVASPVSLIEWFLKFYEQTQHGPVRPVEGVVRTGEVLFVPQGWWHLAINLEETIAITQNFVSRVNLHTVLQLLRSRRSDLLSGCAIKDRGTLHDRFLTALQQRHPELLAEVENKNSALPKAFESQQSDNRDSFSFNFAV